MTARQRAASLAAVITATFGVGLFLGISMPLVSLILERWGVAATLIGLNGAMPALAVLLAGPFLARWIAWLGGRTAMLTGLGIGSAAFLLMPFVPDLGVWFVLRFLMGFALALPWVVGETWINAVAWESTRARIVGIYSAVLFLGIALGPIIVRASGAAGFVPFLIGAGALVLAAAPLMAAWRLVPTVSHAPRLRLSQVIRSAPTVAGAALVAGLVETALYLLLPVYGLRAGVPGPDAAILLTVVITGGIVLQYPIGWAADRVDRQAMLAGIAVTAAVVTPAVGFVGTASWVAWPVLFLLGGLSLGYYGVGLALLGARFAPADLAIANAAFIVLYEAGSFIGPALAGFAMDLWNPQGYLVFLMLVSLVYGVFTLARRRHAP